jgi:hypothetical protein
METILCDGKKLLRSSVNADDAASTADASISAFRVVDFGSRLASIRKL